MASDSNKHNSKAEQSAVSMASVMGNFENSHLAAPNIFSKSLEESQQLQRTHGKPPITAQQKGTKKRPPQVDQTMTQTQQNFTASANQVSKVEQMVSDGRSINAERESQHEKEAAGIGLRKSQEGVYEDVDISKQNNVAAKLVSKLASEAQQKVVNAAHSTVSNTKVPEDVLQQMIKQGFRPSSQKDGQFEYESDSIEKYEMISNEFDFEEVRKGTDFGIKQYKDCIYRG